MDVPQPVSEELRNDLRNLRTLNEWFGGLAIARHAVDLAIAARGGSTLRVLDLATGSGDLPRAMVHRARERNVNISIDAVDAQESTLHIARELSTAEPEIRYHAADIRTFGSGSRWDLVTCFLALHHFTEEDAVALLRRMHTMTSTMAMAADLRRCLIGTAGVWLITETILTDPMTRTDGRMSTQRAFSFQEFGNLARAAGWESFRHKRCFCARQAVWTIITGSQRGDSPSNPSSSQSHEATE